MNNSSDYSGTTDNGASPRPADVWQSIRKVLKPAASLQVTVVLFALSLVLVFFGTVAQTEEGLWTVVENYFRSFFVWIPFQLVAKFGMVFFDLPKTTQWSGSFPFPGGWFIGFAMLGNLLAAHAVRFRLRWNRSGILLIHSGFIALMLGELITGLFAIESKMYLQKGEASNFLDDSRNVELAITWKDGDQEKAIVIPNYLLQREKHIRDERLPVDIEVVEYHKNSALVEFQGGTDEDTLIYAINATDMEIPPGTASGRRFIVKPKSEETGVKSTRDDAPAVRINIREKDSESTLASYFLSLWQYRDFNQRMVIGRPHTFTADGKTYRIELRNRRIYKSYTLVLTDFEHKLYPGTFVPKDFASTVNLNDQEQTDARDGIRIWMNHPLRYRGETFYQSGVLPEDSGTILQVVNNPGWILPYVSCFVVTLGMLVHFSIHLSGFLRRRLAS